MVGGESETGAEGCFGKLVKTPDFPRLFLQPLSFVGAQPLTLLCYYITYERYTFGLIPVDFECYISTAHS
jgi:hypothetical protein